MMFKEKEKKPGNEVRKCVLTNKDYAQVKKYYLALLSLYSEKGIDIEEAAGDLLEILTAADKGDRATVLNISQHPEEVALRFK